MQDDEMTIRDRFSRVADAFVGLSSFSKEVDGLKASIEDLRHRIGDAQSQLDAMRRERDEARAAEIEAKANEKMAREAYETVNARRIDAEAQAANWKADHESLLADHVKLQNDHSFTTHKVRGLEVLLETAKEDREKYRIVSEDAELKVMELEDKVQTHTEVVEKLKMTEEALDACARNTADWKEKATIAGDLATQRNHIIANLERRLGAEEDRNTGLARENEKVILALANIRNALPQL